MELALFYIAAAVAVAGAALVVTRLNASHALIYLVVSLLAIAVMFYLLGAPFAAALEVVIYAGAIVVLFLFVVMMLNLGRRTVERERRWLEPRAWIGPGVLAAILFFEMMYAIVGNTATTGTEAVGPKAVGTALFQRVSAGRGTRGHPAARRTSRRLSPGAPVSQRPSRGAIRVIAAAIPLEHVLFVAAVLFLIGFAGVLVRRNAIFLLMSLEIMMNACGLAFIAAGARWGQPDGQIMFMLILALAAAEVAVALALVLQLERRFDTLDVDTASELNG